MHAIPKLGDIVAVNYHPYFQDIYDVKIAGEPINVLPLMVVVEVYKDARTTYHEHTGDLLTESGKRKCKCVWFSLKTSSFSDAWFSSDSIKIVKAANDDQLTEQSYKEEDVQFKKLKAEWKNKNVNFITSQLELKKIKETKLHDKDTDKLSSYSSLLNFVCPPLEVIDVKLASIKTTTSKFDRKTGERNHYEAKVLFKVRYYNGNSDKWSENLLPLECFEVIPDVSKEIVDLKRDLKEGTIYKLDVSLLQGLDGDEFTEPFSLLAPQEITFINGRYALKVYDWIRNNPFMLEVPDDLSAIADKISKDELFVDDMFPDFNFEKGDRAPSGDEIFSDFSDFIEKHSAEGHYLVLTYVSRADKITRRTLRDYFVVPKSSNQNTYDYLHGFCCKKRDKRSFRFDRILNIKVLNLSTTVV